MNGRRAKKLRKAALMINQNLKDKDGNPVSIGEGYNEYFQARNCVGWGAVTDSDGAPVRDPDGQFLKKVINTLPGTITCAWRFRIIYQALKKEYKHGRTGQDRRISKRRSRYDAAGQLGTS